MWGEPPQAGGGLKQEQATKVAVKNKSHFSNKARSLNRRIIFGHSFLFEHEICTIKYNCTIKKMFLWKSHLIINATDLYEILFY